MQVLEFEKSIVELESKIAELQRLVGTDSSLDMKDEIEHLQQEVERKLQKTYANMKPWQKAQVARHPDRPHAKFYIDRMIDDFTPLAGDRNFKEDHAIVGGLGRFQGQSVVIIGQEKGHDTESRIKCNFGMARPEGYRKAIRLMELADQFGLPVLTLVDTMGAYPGVGAEERGQAEAIARSIQKSLDLTVPIVTAVIGEGGSGGAIAVATSNKVAMMEHAIYSVISPEGCASILWRSGDFAKDAADALRLTAQDLLQLDVIDTIVEEPVGGAHRGPEETCNALISVFERDLAELMPLDSDAIHAQRQQRFLRIGEKTL